MADQQEIKQMIKKYINIDDEMSMLNKQVKDLKKQKTNLEEDIKNYMTNHDIAQVDIGEGSLKLSVKTKTTQKKVSKDTVMDVLLNNIDDHDKVDDIVEVLFEEDEEPEEITKLERKKKK